MEQDIITRTGQLNKDETYYFNLKQDLFHKYLEIKQDLMSDLRDVFLRSNYYSRKYRGTLHTDINVSVSENDFKEHKVHIFIRKDGLYIKDTMIYTMRGLKESQILTNFYD